VAADADEVLLLLSDLRDEVLAVFPSLASHLVSELPDPLDAGRTATDD
jgi:hypothetical protein